MRLRLSRTLLIDFLDLLSFFPPAKGSKTTNKFSVGLAKALMYTRFMR
jgi:hypothetical protein